MPTPIALARRPLNIDVHDDEEVRRWLAQMVSEQVMTRREPVPAIHLLFDGHEEVLDLTEMKKVDPESDLGATWAAMAARTDPERRILVVRLEHPDGKSEACMFEETWEDGVPTAWWFAHRPYTVNDGVGALLESGWKQYAGAAPRPEPFAEMVAVHGRAAQLLPARVPDPPVFMQTGEVPEAWRAPTTAMEMTEHTQAVVLKALEEEGFKHLLVFLVRGRTWEKWLLGDPMPAAGDDMVRWICGRAGQPDAVATAEGVLIQVDGRPERAVRIAAEMNGKRVERAIIMVPKPGKPEDVVPGRWMARELGDVPDGEGWIGVEPVLAGEMTMSVLGMGPPR